MREYLELLVPLLAGERVEHAGERYRVSLQLGALGAHPPPVLLAALGPAMLRLAGAAAGGAAIWLGSRRYLEAFAVPRLREAARAAGRPAPRIACGFPIAVTRDLTAARAGAEALLARSAKLPAYRRVLERGGLARPSDAAIVGDEDAVARELAGLAGIGVTDLTAVPFAVAGDPEAPARTQALLARARPRRRWLAFLLQLERRRVHAVALVGRPRPVVEDVAEMGVAARAEHLGAAHAVGLIGLGAHGALPRSASRSSASPSPTRTSSPS